MMLILILGGAAQLPLIVLKTGLEELRRKLHRRGVCNPDSV